MSKILTQTTEFSLIAVHLGERDYFGHVLLVSCRALADRIFAEGMFTVQEWDERGKRHVKIDTCALKPDEIVDIQKERAEAAEQARTKIKDHLMAMALRPECSQMDAHNWDRVACMVRDLKL